MRYNYCMHGLTLILSSIIFVLLAIIVFLCAFIALRVKRDKKIKQAFELSNRDYLTGLSNKIEFERVVSGVIEHQKHDEIGALVLVEIECLKSDFTVIALANTLISSFRIADLKSRCDKNVFAVFMRNVFDVDSVAKKVSDLQSAIKSQNIKSVAGICWCKGPQIENTFVDIYYCASTALLTAKEAGNDSFAIVGK